MRARLRRLREVYANRGAGGAVRAVGGFLRRRLPSPRRRLKAYRVDRWKRGRDPADLAYEHDPRVSFVVQWFNQREHVDRVAPRLPDGPAYETVVCEDGSVDGSLAAWDERLTRRNDFLVRSNDLHEVRAYTRAIGLSRGEFVCLLQDDDVPPDDTSWIDATVDLFERYPDLGVVCGQSGWGLQDLVPDYRFEPPVEGGHEVTDRWLREGGGVKDEHPEEVPTSDPETGRPFVFVPCISVGPVVVRRSVYDALGGFDLDFSEPGKPGMGFEVDFGLRCWRAGYRVAFTPMGFDRGDVGGTLMFAPEERDRAKADAWERLRAKHRDAFDLVSKRVHAANAQLDER